MHWRERLRVPADMKLGWRDRLLVTLLQIFWTVVACLPFWRDEREDPPHHPDRE